MATVSSTRVLSIYKSRGTILDQLESQGYNVGDYIGFSINEVDAMYGNDQLDMLLETKDEPKRKTYIKYYLTAKQLKPNNLDEMIEDLFVIENALTKSDNLIIILDDEPNQTIIKKVQYLFDHDGIFVVLHNIQRLQFNVLNHRCVPKCTILNETETAVIKKKYNIKDNSQFPEISRFDPQALAMSVRPGEICKFERNSATAMKYDYFRLCV
jgi:DNA-directed RNA polymerase subunit H (RpoH/RPB5)